MGRAAKGTRMRTWVRAVAGLTAAVLATVMPHAAHAVDPILAPRTVTLITGDRLLIAPDGTTVSRLPTPGRDRVPLLSRFAAGRLEAVPADALPLVNAGRLD